MSFITQNEDDFVLLLKESDFPPYFENHMHPDDYKLHTEPIIEKIFHRKIFHNRLLLRICFKIDNNTYIPITFVVDTGCPMFLYLCPKALDEFKNIIEEDELGIKYIVVNGKKFTIDETPHIYKNINIIGLLALNNFGLHLTNFELEFDNIPNYL